ncbi:MAG: hypothetical protein U1E14_08610 [Geminicoccaceae bacterium]
MPDEHLRLPKTAEEWKDYRRASGEALAEGELAERWLLEQPKTTATPSLASYLYAAGKVGSRDPTSGARFDAWRQAEERSAAVTATAASREIETFGKIVGAEPQARAVSDDALRESVGMLRGLPANINLADLPGRRNRNDRGAWEIAAETLMQHGIDPGGTDFGGELREARIRVQRNAGDLGLVFGGFLRSAELAVATARKETVPSTSWRQSELSALGEDLRRALLDWDSARKSFPDLNESDVRPRAEACHACLVAFASACGPTGELAQSAAFVGITGLAMTMALGERLGAQIHARANVPSVQGLYERISEVPAREYTQPNLATYQNYSTNYQKLASAWREDTDYIKAQLSSYKKSIVGYDQYKDICVGKQFAGVVADQLETWDKLLRNSGTLTSGSPPDELRKVVNRIVDNLTYLRNYVEITPTTAGDLNNPMAASAIDKIKEFQLARIDAVTAQMQRRLALALQVT